MKRHSSPIHYLLLMLLFLGCASMPHPRPVINSAVWNSVTREHVFESCLKALHMQGYGIKTTDSTLGIIGTEWITFREGVVNSKYRLNILVSKDTHGAVIITVTTPGGWAADRGYRVDEQMWSTYLNNRISADLDGIFMQIEKLIGKPASSKEHTILSWK